MSQRILPVPTALRLTSNMVRAAPNTIRYPDANNIVVYESTSSDTPPSVPNPTSPQPAEDVASYCIQQELQDPEQDPEPAILSLVASKAPWFSPTNITSGGNLSCWWAADRVCPVAGCNSVFERLEDLNRHYEVYHGVGNDNFGVGRVVDAAGDVTMVGADDAADDEADDEVAEAYGDQAGDEGGPAGAIDEDPHDTDDDDKDGDLNAGGDHADVAEQASLLWQCDYPYCQAGTRRFRTFLTASYLRDHLRVRHKEDLTKDPTKAFSEHTEKWFKERIVHNQWWRCSRCLIRVTTSLCSKCKGRCQPARVNERIKRFGNRWLTSIPGPQIDGMDNMPAPDGVVLFALTATDGMNNNANDQNQLSRSSSMHIVDDASADRGSMTGPGAGGSTSQLHQLQVSTGLTAAAPTNCVSGVDLSENSQCLLKIRSACKESPPKQLVGNG